MILRKSYLYLLIISTWLPQMTCGCPNGCQCTQTGWGQRAFCRGGILTEILSSITKDIHQLHVSQATNLQVLRQEDFNHLKGFSLTRIFLTQCSIQKIEGSVFSGLKFLLELSFSENNINIISDNAFMGLVQLKRLDLSKNRIGRIGTMLHTLESLEHLDLSENNLNNIEAGSFLTLANLVLLKLNGNQLQKINGEIFKGLNNLNVLSLRNCDLMTIDSDLFNVVKRISTLDFGGNRLSLLPQSKDFIKLKYLKTLLLDHNEITNLHDYQFAGMTLYKLSLSNNRINKLTKKTFANLEVRELDLSYNIIYNIIDYFLLTTAQLVEVVNLAGNPLRHLPDATFQSLHRLHHLNLSSCALEKLGVNQFHDLNNLRSLDLSHNSLQYIPLDCFVILNKLQTLNIQNNPWHCDCNIRSLRSWLQEPKSTSIMFCKHTSELSENCKYIRCTTPASFYDQKVLGLRTTDIEECQQTEKSDALSVNTQIAIVIPCILVSIILLIIAICLWRRGRTREELRKVCMPVEQESSHLDFEKKPRPFENSEIRSLNESDKGFVFRNYFQTMVSNPSRVSYPTISQRDVDSVYSSQPSLYSSCSRVHQQTVGIESTV